MSAESTETKRSVLSRTLLWLLSNGPAVIAVLGSAVLAVAASIAHVTEMQILQAIVVLLALIGTSLLTERLVEGRALRSRLSELSDRVDQALCYARDVQTASLDALIIRRRDLPPLEERLSGAKHVAILGGSLFRLANEYRNLFEQLAADGCTLRFLLTDPEKEAAEFLSSAVVYESNDSTTYRNHMRAALAGLNNLASQYPNVCEVKVYAIAPPFSLVLVDKGNDASSIQVELYPFRLPARDRPMLWLTKKRDPRLHGLFTAQFEAMWSSNFSCSPKPSTQEPPQKVHVRP